MAKKGSEVFYDAFKIIIILLIPEQNEGFSSPKNSFRVIAIFPSCKNYIPIKFNILKLSS
ncbi:hypothetical protein B0A62_17210 [Flavobacterium hydatis]|uniref:Uncharacterized protein n=1 Tax=Flavobacterium hydatis TaxID=991 RepID=A0A085ZZ57_FLAHY|nr:hypothetical protein IW20_22830 [Flavobacterium hydatis]OXA91416.1 hypothetical protein B0A62_17210 [Flavobacterium hydatis]